MSLKLWLYQDKLILMDRLLLLFAGMLVGGNNYTFMVGSSFQNDYISIFRQHFKEIAEHLNMSVEELATSVLNKSVGDQLTMLKDFYKSKFQETDAVYEPLLELYSSKEEKNEGPSEKSLPKKRKTSEAPAVTVRVKKSFPLILSSDSETEDQKNKANEKPSNKTRQQAIKSSNKRSTAVNATLTR